MPALLCDQVFEYIRAGFSGIWINSNEHRDALTEITNLCIRNNFTVRLFDADVGHQMLFPDKTYKAVATNPTRDFAAVIRELVKTPPTANQPPHVLIARNMHPWVNVQQIAGLPNRSEVLSLLSTALAAYQKTGVFLIMLSGSTIIPPELEKEFVIVDHPLPDRNQILQIMQGLANREGEMPGEGPELDACIEAAMGGTRLQVENACALSLVRHNKLDINTIWDLKSQWVRRSGSLSLYSGTAGFDTIGGMKYLKSFCAKALANRSDDPNLKPKGVLLLGPPGTGKSAFAKALGVETGRKTVIMDLGAQRAKWVGETEQRLRQDLNILDAMGRIIVFIDEIEKALGGGESSNATDGGVTTRTLGTLLTWLNDRAGDVFLVGTCNDVTTLPDSFTRAERFDGIFFVNTPDYGEQAEIWAMYLKMFGLDPDQRMPKQAGWTGAEIKTCCRLAALLGEPLLEAAKHVVPISVSSKESVNILRKWASGRCLSASDHGLYHYVEPPTDPYGSKEVKAGFG